MSRTGFWGNGKHNPHGTPLALASLTGGLRTRNVGGIASLGWPRGGRQMERASRMSRTRSLTKGKTRLTAGKGGSISHGKPDISSTPTGRAIGERSPERPTLSCADSRRGFRVPGDFWK